MSVDASAFYLPQGIRITLIKFISVYSHAIVRYKRGILYTLYPLSRNGNTSQNYHTI